MDKFNKITIGFVVQNYEKDQDGNFICSHQEFIAGDQVNYELEDETSIEPVEHKYQPYNMTL